MNEFFLGWIELWNECATAVDLYFFWALEQDGPGGARDNGRDEPISGGGVGGAGWSVSRARAAASAAASVAASAAASAYRSVSISSVVLSATSRLLLVTRWNSSTTGHDVDDDGGGGVGDETPFLVVAAAAAASSGEATSTSTTRMTRRVPRGAISRRRRTPRSVSDRPGAGGTRASRTRVARGASFVSRGHAYSTTQPPSNHSRAFIS